MNGNTAPDLATLRESLHVSYSQIRSYTICPAKFNHSYILGTAPSHRPVAMVLGGTIHKALAAFYSHVQKSGEAMPLESVCDVYRAAWEAEMDREIPIVFDDGADSGKVLDQGIGLLTAFHAKAQIPQVVSVEEPFAVDLMNPATGEVRDMKLIGAFDLVTMENNHPVIIEHKTAARRYSKDQLAYDLQPSVYAYAADQMGMDSPDLRYQLLLKTKTPGHMLCDIQRTESDIREMLETIISVLDGIEAEVFYRQRGWACGDCQYAYACGAT